ncbi:hypothetical protein VYU27_002491 [Nannochloropsis oceanica]
MAGKNLLPSVKGGAMTTRRGGEEGGRERGGGKGGRGGKGGKGGRGRRGGAGRSRGAAAAAAAAGGVGVGGTGGGTGGRGGEREVATGVGRRRGVAQQEVEEEREERQQQQQQEEEGKAAGGARGAAGGRGGGGRGGHGKGGSGGGPVIVNPEEVQAFINEGRRLLKLEGSHILKVTSLISVEKLFLPYLYHILHEYHLKGLAVQRGIEENSGMQAENGGNVCHRGFLNRSSLQVSTAMKRRLTPGYTLLKKVANGKPEMAEAAWEAECLDWLGRLGEMSQNDSCKD